MTGLLSGYRDAMRESFLSLPPIVTPDDARRQLFPGERCQRCHPSAFEIWQAKPHARSWIALVDAGRTDDVTCLACHTTGMRHRRYGWTRFEEMTDRHRRVDCVMCHGAVDIPDTGQCDVERPRPTDYCTTCHSVEHDSDFDYERARNEILHQRH